MQYKTPLLLALASVASAQTPSLTDALGSQNSSLSSLSALIASDSSFADALNNLHNITILAPSNDALNALNDSTSLLTNPGYLQALLSYHVLNGTHLDSSFGNDSVFIRTQLTNSTYTNVTGGQVVEARLNDNNVTFFSALKENASVITPNINFTGGTIHIIDNLLVIPQNVTETLSNANLTAAEGAINAANLTDSLANTHDITIFAPNNDAFDAIGNLVANFSSDQLTSVIGYHVINGSVAYSSQLSNTSVQAVNGQNLTITVIDGTVYVNSAKVTVPDILIENGVVHVIDGVLNPDNASATPDTTATTTAPAFSGASTGTDGVPFTSGVTTPTTTFPAATSAGGSETTSSSEGAAVPKQTGAIGAAALFGGAVIFANL